MNTESKRLGQLPPYLFASLDKKKRELAAKGVDLIDLSVGDPDIPTPSHIIEALHEGAKNPKNHRYPPYNGTKEFRDAAALYLKRSRGIALDSETEILTLIGSKEGIAHAPFAFADPGDIVLAASPGYPVYRTSAILAGCIPYEVALRKENGFLPDFQSIPKDILSKARILFINYPNNPTAAVASLDFFKEAVDFARKNKLILCHDAAYLEIVYDGYKAPSILEVDGAKEVAIEFHSLSKTYNMTGWRIGFAAGNKDLLASLGKFKTHIDSSATAAVQHAGAVAMTSDQTCVGKTNKIFQERRDIVVSILNKSGWKVTPPKSTFYIWSEAPMKGDFASFVLEKTGVVITPGLGFGKYGEGFVRISLTSPTERIREGMERIAKVLK